MGTDEPPFQLPFSIDSLNEPKFHSLYSETQWFERNAFVVSGTDILNVNPEVHIQHVAENSDHSVRAVVTLNTFHVMVMITTEPLYYYVQWTAGRTVSLKTSL